jgi:hypothetical protein
VVALAVMGVIYGATSATGIGGFMRITAAMRDTLLIVELTSRIILVTVSRRPR